MISSSWDITNDHFADLLRKLAFDYYKWDIYVSGRLKIIPQSLIIEQDEYQEALKVCLAIAEILSSLEKKIKTNREVLRKLAIPEKTADLIVKEGESEWQLARYDLFRTADGNWILSEFNEDVPGGFNESIGIPELLSSHFSGYSFENFFKKQFQECFCDIQGVVGLMYASGYSEDLQHMAILEALLKASGKQTLYCTPAQLVFRRGIAYMNDTPIEALIRFYPGEWFDMLPNYNHWQKAISKLKILNPLSRLIRQSKNLFALWNEDSFLDREQKDFIRSVTPETYFFGEVKDKFQHFPKEEWVIKHAFGRMGDSVTIGALVTQETWEKTWDFAAKNAGEFTLQKKFEVATTSFNGSAMYPALGVYLINNQFAGFYSRVCEKPFLTHEACYVPTLVRVS